MQIDIRHSPSFAIARCVLTGGEAVKVEAGAMAAHSAGMQLESKAEGGMLKALKRGALGGESIFISTYTAPGQGGWVDVAPRLPGDVFAVHLDKDSPLCITKGSWLCSAPTVELDTKWAGLRSMVGGEGAFMALATGYGDVALSCYGALDVMTLKPGEQVVVDTGHMVAYETTVTVNARKAASGLMASMKSGEGMVFEITGPGDVLVQSRNPGLMGTAANSLGGRA